MADVVGVFKSIGGWFKKAAVYVSRTFVAIFGSDAAKKFGSAALDLLKTQAGVLALDAVNFAATLATDGAGKREAALKKLAADLKAAGIDVTLSLQNLLVEIAVAYLKGHFGII